MTSVCKNYRFYEKAMLFTRSKMMMNLFEKVNLLVNAKLDELLVQQKRTTPPAAETSSATEENSSMKDALAELELLKRKAALAMKQQVTSSTVNQTETVAEKSPLTLTMEQKLAELEATLAHLQSQAEATSTTVDIEKEDPDMKARISRLSGS